MSKTDSLRHSQMIEQLFAQRQLRCTRQRRALYEALASTQSHPTAEELYTKLSASGTSVSLATVYNTLETFCDAGLAQKLPGKGGCARYDAATQNHLHLRDRCSGAVFDAPDHISAKLFEHLPHKLLQQLADNCGFEIEQIQIELVGRFANTSAARQTK